MNHDNNLLPHDGLACVFPDAFTPEESDHYLAALQQDMLWKQEPITLFGRQVMQPRLTAWYGDTGKSYTYSGITMQPMPWTPDLEAIKERAEQVTGYNFNSCLLNLYRNGLDSMGWHRDNEKALGPEPAIASVSFGAARIFRFRNYLHQKEVISTELAHGSLLLMAGSTQTHWQHALPKSRSVDKVRINLTFRNIVL